MNVTNGSFSQRRSTIADIGSSPANAIQEAGNLYVCEAPSSSSVTSISTWCSRTSGHWSKVGSSYGTGYWTSSLKSCFAGTGVYYPTPVGKVAVSFNMVIKAGIGHGVAPAEIFVVRYN